jgi:hypothetical protein
MADVAPKVEDLADEIARQTDEAMQESGLTWDDVQAALHRLGLPVCKTNDRAPPISARGPSNAP